MADKLGPVEVEFTIPDDFGKQADAAIKKMAGLTDTSTSAVKQVKEAYESQKAVIKQIESDIKELERQLKNVAPGKGKMELTQEIGAARQALTEETAILNQRKVELDQSAVKQDRVTTSIRATRNEMAQMILAGKEQSQEFKDLEAKAAGYVEALNQANQVTKSLGDDQRSTKGLMEGATGLSGAFSAGAGAVALFAGENENLVKIQTKVQGLMAITIGLQEVSQALDKESAFMSVTVAKAKQMWATAEKALTAALWGSNVAAKALMGTLTLGLAVAIPALISLYDRWKTKQAEAAEAYKRSMEVTTEANIAAGKVRIELDLLINKLKTFNGSKADEKRIVDEVNRKYGEVFGTYKTVAEWLDVLKRKSDDYVNSMFKQARIQAIIKKANEADERANNILATPESDYISTKDILFNTGAERRYWAKRAKQAEYNAAIAERDMLLNTAKLEQTKYDISGEFTPTPTPSITPTTSNIVAQTFDQQIQLVKKGLELYKMAVDDGLNETANVIKSKFQIPEGITSYSDYINEELNKALAAGDQDKVIALLPEKDALDAQINKAAGDIDLTPILEKYQTYQDKVKSVTDKYNSEIKALRAKGYNDQADIAKKAMDEELKTLSDQLLKESDKWKFLFADLGNATSSQLKKIIAEAESKIASETDINKIIELRAQIDKLKESVKSLDEKAAISLFDSNSWGKLYNDVQAFNNAEAGSVDQANALVSMLKEAVNVINEAVAGLDDMTNLLQTAGMITQDQADSMKDTNQQIQGVVDGLSSVLTGNPAEGVNGLIRALDNLIKLHDYKGKKIAKYQSDELSKISEIERAYNKLQSAVNNAIGTDLYAKEREQIQLNIDKINEYQNLIDSEMQKKAKKRDQDKIKEWQDQIDQIKATNEELTNSITEQLTQTNVSDFAGNIADAIVGAFDAGTDATIAWGNVVDNVMRNAVINALKLKYLDKPIKDAMDELSKDMADGLLSPEEAARVRAIVAGPTAQFNAAMSAGLQALGFEPGTTTSAGSSANGKADFSYMKQETGDALLGQFTALRMSAALVADIAQDEMMSRRAMFQDLKQIAENTFQSAQSLKSIDSRIQTIENEGIKIK